MSLWGEYKAGMLTESQYTRACREEAMREEDMRQELINDEYEEESQFNIGDRVICKEDGLEYVVTDVMWFEDDEHGWMYECETVEDGGQTLAEMFDSDISA